VWCASGLVGADRCADSAADFCKAGEILGHYRLLDELEIELLKLADHPHGHARRPRLVRVNTERDVGPMARRIASAMAMSSRGAMPTLK
jgi:hypothetical protein